MTISMFLSYLLLLIFPEVYASLDAVSKRYGHSLYMLIKVPQNFSTSRTTCLDHEMDLAVVTDSDEQEFVTLFISSQPSAQDTWIGLYKTADDHSTLRWVDDSPFVFNDSQYYQPWRNKEPNSPTHRGIRIKAEYSEWADHPFSRQYWAICEISLSVSERSLYNKRNGPITVSPVTMTLKATSVTNSLLKCNLETECFVVKVTSSGDVTGEVDCHLYKADDGKTSMTISDFYVK